VSGGERCASCGSQVGRTRDGLCPDCWYGAPERPGPVRDRFEKLRKLEASGFQPYAYEYDPTDTLAGARDRYVEAGEPEEGPRVRVAGRILSFRDLGGSAFAHLGDRDGRLQVHLKRDLLSGRDVELLDLLDLGDWVGVEGPLFRTRTGEVTVRAERLVLLAKTLRPLPYGKVEVTGEGERLVHGGFSNRESRYRQRYADLAVNPEVRRLFELRTRIVSGLRSFLDARGFLEVETPILQPMYGGAAARPFTTHHNALDTTLYLRIADELYLKRLLVGNLDRVYEIGKDFRNEGIDRTHNPEFTMLELYQAFADYRAMMELTETMVTSVLESACGTLRFRWEGSDVDLSPPWPRVSFRELLAQRAGVDVSASSEELRRAAREAGREDAADLSRPALIDALFSARVEPSLIDPTIVYDYPIEMSPFAKPRRGDPAMAERFEVVVGGHELVNAFSELNDPLDQWRRFADQAVRRSAGEEEAEGFDEDYLRALEYGLPPTGGLGMGVDRLIMMAAGEEAIREVILYPILRPGEGA
jgi:lysyl-tRNA synthetase class 2